MLGDRVIWKGLQHGTTALALHLQGAQGEVGVHVDEARCQVPAVQVRHARTAPACGVACVCNDADAAVLHADASALADAVVFGVDDVDIVEGQRIVRGRRGGDRRGERAGQGRGEQQFREGKTLHRRCVLSSGFAS
ncbi:MAG: hypothetical protein A2579_09255 [Lysobacterales bacterium RIFOXYD1_FULL_69_11]|nr:MAG: hypothetical protein A2579_09255 [Xanthomonadales bacterium RIFOXYD1_FULL_69_11]